MVVKLKHFSLNHSADTMVVVFGVCKFQRVSAASHPPAWGAVFGAVCKSMIAAAEVRAGQPEQNGYRLSQKKKKKKVTGIPIPEVQSNPQWLEGD